MKHRNAAALALVGWYLMLPPLDHNLKPQTAAPLYQWEATGEPSLAGDEGTPDDPFSTSLGSKASWTTQKKNRDFATIFLDSVK
jgi:hypothetical protein